MDNFGENEIVETKYYRKSMASAMKTYRSKFSDEKRAEINEYQKDGGKTSKRERAKDGERC